MRFLASVTVALGLFAANSSPVFAKNSKLLDFGAQPDVAKRVTFAPSLRSKSAQPVLPKLNGAFGTNAITFPIGHTKSKWARVSNASMRSAFDGCRTRDCKRTATYFRNLLGTGEQLKFVDKLRLVNAGVNRRIEYQTDNAIYNQTDYWATPEETLAARAGDCEDFATLKMALLESLGVPKETMSVVIVKDMIRQLYHAVLAVRTNKGFIILDNAYQNIVMDYNLPQYMALFSLSETRSWLHGHPAGAADQIRTAISASHSEIKPGMSAPLNTALPLELR